MLRKTSTNTMPDVCTQPIGAVRATPTTEPSASAMANPTTAVAAVQPSPQKRVVRYVLVPSSEGSKKIHQFQ
ncbi:hypothetical protein D3C80_770550 [compost metagenome]